MLLNWPKSAHDVKIPGTPVHGSAAFPLLLMLMHIRLWTLVLALGTIVFLTYMRSKGRTTTWMIRRMKTVMRGGWVAARPSFYVRRMSRIEGFDTLMYPSRGLHQVRAVEPKSGRSKSPQTQKSTSKSKAPRKG